MARRRNDQTEPIKYPGVKPCRVRLNPAGDSYSLPYLSAGAAQTQTISFERPRSFGIDVPDGEPGTGFNQVLSGDWDGDGMTDLAFLGSDGRIYLFAGDGAGGFRTAGQLDRKGSVVAAADVNSDGRTDLLVLDDWTDAFAPNELSVFLSEGGFRFAPPLRIRSQGRPWIGFQVADLNGDGKPDLLVFPNGLYLSVLWGSGDGTFSDPLRTPVFFSLLVAVADFDQDGFPDLLASDLSGKLQILFGRGDGTFDPQTASISGNYGYAGWCPIGAADADGDRYPDLWIGGDELFCPGLWRLPRDRSRELRYHRGLTRAYLQVPASKWFADLNRDGFPDLIALPAIRAGDGKGGFAPPVTLPDLPAAGYGLVVDVNRDDLPDLIIADGSPRLTLVINSGN